MTTLTIAGVHKAFGQTQALAGIDLTLQSGEVLGIAGPNGAGKSTLIKMLAGEEVPDSGRFLLDDRPWSPVDAVDRAAIVHQEPHVWLNLTLGDNLLVGRERSRFGLPTLSRAEHAILDDLQLSAYASRPLGDCSLAIRQRTEIARALAQEAKLFLFDEPNSALTEDESNSLFAYMHQLSASGRIVVLVSHRLAELVTHCQRVAIIRDGRVAATLGGGDLSEEAIALELVVGQERSAERDGRRMAGMDTTRSALRPPAPGDTPDAVGQAVGLTIDAGEIVAVVGVEGSGGREIVASTAGYAVVNDRVERRRATEPNAAPRLGSTAYLPADRRAMLFPNLPVSANLVMRLGSPEIASPLGLLRNDQIRALATRLIAHFGIRTPGPEAALPSLSGGNQQKVAIAAAIARQPRLLALEEPTRGVDVGAKSDIYRILRGFAAEGNAILVYCTEAPEVFELADCVVTVDRGRVSQPLRVAEYPDVASLAAAIARAERTEVQAGDVAASHARVGLAQNTTADGHHA